MDNQWKAIVVTAANTHQSEAYQGELEKYQRSGFIEPDTLVLSVPDPSSERVGSGGATLNALLCVTEHLSARAGYTYIEPEILRTSRILIIHSGGDSQRIPLFSVCGKAFSTLPVDHEKRELITPFLILLQKLNGITKKVKNGLFIASGDVLLSLPEMDYKWGSTGCTGLAIPAPLEYAEKHGVYCLEQDGNRVKTFLQKPTQQLLKEVQAIRNDQKVLLDSGIVYFCEQTTVKLLTLNVFPPLDACTYLGVDNGATPLRIELYSDILLCMARETNREEYMNMPSSAIDLEALQKAREKLWDSLHTLPFSAVVAEQGHFHHLGTTKEYVDVFLYKNEFLSDFNFQKTVRSFIEEAELVENSVVINSLLYSPGKAESGSVIEHSELRGNWYVGKRAICSGLRSYPGIRIEDGIVVKEIHLRDEPPCNNRRIIILYGVDDNIKDSYDDSNATFTNRPWKSFFDTYGIQPEDIWLNDGNAKSNLWNAKLFPILKDDEWLDTVLWMQNSKKPSSIVLRKWRNSTRLSLGEVLSQADPVQEFRWISELSHKLDLHYTEETLLERKNVFLLPIFQRCAKERKIDVLDHLDTIAKNAPTDTAGRTLSTIADALSTLSENKGGLRSGPMRNIQWKIGFDLLREGQISEAVDALSEQRKHWLNSPERLVRAARHYEGAAQVLISKSVETAPIEWKSTESPPLEKLIQAEIPARIDLAGGWTDTPPITYEHGGVVVNMGVKIDGEKPIGAAARKIKEPILSFQLGDHTSPIVCRDLGDIKDFSQPLAPAALCKAALLTAGIVTLQSSKSLREQLEDIGGGIELKTWSHLPTGSGLGTSSILAAALIPLLGKLAGKKFDLISIIHAVLLLEQKMTTGGGWQDQVGGLYPGIKISSSSNRLPLHVYQEKINVPTSMIDSINQNSLLVYTGRTRLARNLLQDVIRRWYARYPNIVNLVNELTENAKETKNALIKGDLEKLGVCLTKYWEQKKQMAGGTEPPHVGDMIKTISAHTFGYSLTGAGGGGFLFLLLKNADEKERVKEKLNHISSNFSLTFHETKVDDVGLVIH